MIVAIHQPNYFPWLGYFRKMIEADVFIFLDDVQFSKGSYTNRVGIRSGSGRRW
ncbi:MAG: WbqC family protein, partial [Pseudomonadota bacterium]|nr:WbqC family protein [Pseudomonadota bacterium]